MTPIRNDQAGYCLNCSPRNDPDAVRVHEPVDCPWRPEQKEMARG